MKRVLNEMHCPRTGDRYGQTETSPVVTMSHADDTIEIRVSNGRAAMPQTEIVCLHANGEALPSGARARCAARYALMKGSTASPSTRR